MLDHKMAFFSPLQEKHDKVEDNVPKPQKLYVEPLFVILSVVVDR